MNYKILAFIALNPYKFYSNSSINVHDNSIDYRETWQNSILSGILKPYRRKRIELEDIEDEIEDKDVKLKVEEIIRSKTDRLKSSIQKKFIKQILTLNCNQDRLFINIDTITSNKLGNELSNALIWFSNKYESFFNPNSLNTELESKIDKNSTFEELGIKNVKLNMNLNNPTFSQKIHIPRVINYLKNNINGDNRWKLSNSDDSMGLFYHSSNGSGKTFSYLLPILQIGCQNTIIVIPTRELSVQVFKIIKSLFPENINQYLLIGGANIKHQVEKLKLLDCNKNNIFVTTPGRFIDLTSRKILNIKNINNFIFDEYDSYFNLSKNSNNVTVKDSFNSIIQTIYKIKNNISNNFINKKIIFCSAIDRRQQVHNLIKNEDITKSGVNGEQSDSVTHFLVTYNEGKDKISLFKKLLQIKPTKKSIIIFVNYHKHIDFLTNVINSFIPKANLIQLSSDDSKIDRQKSFDKLYELKNNCKSNNLTNICITTDISSRGIDFSPFTYLINYSTPTNLITYNNRCGRLNFSGKRGMCITMCQGSEMPKFGRIILKNLSVPIHAVEPIQGVLFKKRNQSIPYAQSISGLRH